MKTPERQCRNEDVWGNSRFWLSILSPMRRLHSRLCSGSKTCRAHCYQAFVNTSSRDITTRTAGEGRGHLLLCPAPAKSTARAVSGPRRRAVTALDLGLPGARLKGHHEKQLLKAVLMATTRLAFSSPGSHTREFSLNTR